jgi:hypothetical protein
MFKTEEIHDVFTKQIGVKINNETARQQTPVPAPTDVDRANALRDRILEIIFRGAENDPPDDIRKTETTSDTGNTKTAETTKPQTNRTTDPPTYHISRIQPR